MYKAGQIVTVDGKRFKITKTLMINKCAKCNRMNGNLPCVNAQGKFAKVCLNMPKNCYLKQINPARG